MTVSSFLTARQREVLDFIKSHQRQNGMPPTRAEISKHFGWASVNAAEEHVKALRRKGAIRLEGIARGIFLT